MRTETREYKVYSFDELSDEAKEKAIEWYREQKNQFDDYMFDCVLDDWKEKLVDMGFLDPKIYFSGFSCQGDGACFEASCYLPDLIKEFDTKKYRHLIPFINEGRITCSIETNSYGNHYSHQRTRYISLDYPFWYDAYPKASSLCEELKEELEGLRYELSCKIYNQLEEEYYYQMSDECIIEDIKANEYEFLENGKVFN
jgi:hypothetical protein